MALVSIMPGQCLVHTDSKKLFDQQLGGSPALKNNRKREVRLDPGLSVCLYLLIDTPWGLHAAGAISQGSLLPLWFVGLSWDLAWTNGSSPLTTRNEFGFPLQWSIVFFFLISQDVLLVLTDLE